MTDETNWVNRIHEGDCLEVLPKLPEESVHAVVTDPPYGLAFMGRSWDDFEPKEYQAFCEEWARECKRVLKPGGHLLAFSGNRTHHRLFSGVEDAGLEIRDTITWHYGSGFPKALDVSKAIDKAADAEREVVKEHHQAESERESGGNALEGSKDGSLSWHYEITAPATDAARKWDGWKTALKPATEYVVMARKPFDSTVAECMQTHGTGALNIDGCRIGVNDRAEYEANTNRENVDSHWGNSDGDTSVQANEEGRYPSNVIFDETQADALDREVGECDSGDYAGRDATGESMFLDTDGDPRMDNGAYEDRKSGPSRYFYTSKATKAERTLDGKIDNAHPTVKPPDLMEWLVKLVSAEGQIVLDPFAGSGTTCRAAKDLQRKFIGIEQQPKWADVARVRCGLPASNPEHVRGDDAQAGLEQF